MSLTLISLAGDYRIVAGIESSDRYLSSEEAIDIFCNVESK